MEKICLDCGKTVIGRADKKFCDDQCRSNFNNREKTRLSEPIKKINAILLKNKRILDELNTEGKTKVAKLKLEKAGFNFNYFTHKHITQNGNSYTFCYDQGYLPLENQFYLLVRNDF